MPGRYKRIRVTRVGDPPIPDPVQTGGVASASGDLAERILDLVDPLGPTRPGARRYDALGPVDGPGTRASGASHAPPLVCGPTEFSAGVQQVGVNASPRRRMFEGG